MNTLELLHALLLVTFAVLTFLTVLHSNWWLLALLPVAISLGALTNAGMALGE